MFFPPLSPVLHSPSPSPSVPVRALAFAFETFAVSRSAGGRRIEGEGERPGGAPKAKASILGCRRRELPVPGVSASDAGGGGEHVPGWSNGKTSRQLWRGYARSNRAPGAGPPSRRPTSNDRPPPRLVQRTGRSNERGDARSNRAPGRGRSCSRCDRAVKTARVAPDAHRTGHRLRSGRGQVRLLPGAPSMSSPGRLRMTG